MQASAKSHVFLEEINALKRLLFNEKLENLRHAHDFEQPREVLGFIQALLASILRTEAPTDADPHRRQWLRLQQYAIGFPGGNQTSKRGIIEILFDSLEALLPQERFVRTAGPQNSWTVDGDILEIQLNFGADHTEERELFSWNLKGLSCCPSEKNRSKIVPLNAVCEALQLQIEILHIIAALLRVSWKVCDWKGGEADSAKIEFWHPQLGYLPRVLQRFYSCEIQNHENRQIIWSDRIQRLRTSEMFAQNPLVECLADQVTPPPFSLQIPLLLHMTQHRRRRCRTGFGWFSFRHSTRDYGPLPPMPMAASSPSGTLPHGASAPLGLPRRAPSSRSSPPASSTR
jgi:hypothetical protein